MDNDQGDAPPRRRRANGTYEKGVSGNRKGRPPKDKRIMHPETFRDIHYDVADVPVPITIDGKRLHVTLFEANLLTLATAGASGDKKSAQVFIRQMTNVSEQELGNMQHLIKRLDGIEPAYNFERDPAKRAALREAWHRTMAEATGERDRTTKGVLKRRRRARGIKGPKGAGN